MSVDASAAKGPPPATGRWWQIPLGLLYLLGCLVHAVCLLWLFLIPRYRREGLARRLAQDPWAWYTRQLLLRSKIRVKGREHLPSSRNGFVYAANHESIVDILLLTAVVRRAFLMKKSVLLSPIGWGTYLSGSIGFDRTSPSARIQALHESLEMARRSMSLVVFPEGTFGHADGRLRRAHLNLLKHAHDKGVPVVPLGHAGTRRALDGQRLPMRWGAELVLVARPPVCPTDFSSRDDFAEAAWQQVIEAVREARSLVPSGWPYVADPAARPSLRDPSPASPARPNEA